MNVDSKLTGGAAVGAAIAVYLTHGGDYQFEEIAALSAGIGAAVTYLAAKIDRLMAWKGE